MVFSVTFVLQRIERNTKIQGRLAVSQGTSAIQIELGEAKLTSGYWETGQQLLKVAPYSFWTARELISKISRWRELSISTLKSRAESRSKMPTNMASKFLKFVYR